jgi:acyl-CoA reductase-like NAD-dependent aldehyde dehydrogenase
MTDLHAKPQVTSIEVRNPADGTVVGEVPNESAETVAATARELRVYQPEWEALGAKGRKPWLMKFQDWILDNAEHIADVLRPSQASRVSKLRWKRRCAQTCSTTGRVGRRRSWPTATPSRTTY